MADARRALDHRHLGRPRPRHRGGAGARGLRPGADRTRRRHADRTRWPSRTSRSRKAVAFALDLRSQDSIKAAFEQATEGLGDIDLLVNNAGRALLKPAVDVTDAEWDDVIDTNLKGAFFLSQLFGRDCIANGRPGAIVSMASTHGMTGIAGRSVYGISKAGLIQMTRMLAIEWADKNIRVNAIAPTTVMTESRQQMLADPDKRAAALARIPSGNSRRPRRSPPRWSIWRARARPRSPATPCRSTAG